MTNRQDPELTICGTGADCERSCPFIRPGQACPSLHELRALAMDTGRTLAELMSYKAFSASATT
ncbi:hypothetical protein [Microbacterium sp. KR10-403]|uniref:hypothetical protein n=1 Tax=Microbacterium sp. KR10-403 TaxID=3158581 RepID=UPI0032E4DC8D